MHAYFYMRLQAAFPLSLSLKVITTILLAFMAVCPILIYLLERLGQETAALLLSYLAYLWMGIVFFFCCLALLLELYRLLLHIGVRLGLGPMIHITPSAKLLFLLPLVTALIVNGYGYWEAQQIRTERLSIRSAKIPPQIGRLRIVQISDVHVGIIVNGERLSRIVAAVQAAQPDILVSTGDLVDGQLDSLYRAVDLLRSLSPRYGKYAVTGNHEFHAGLNKALRFTQDSGFRILRGEAATVAHVIRIVGVDDPTARQRGIDPRPAERDLLASKEDARLFTVLLKHQPIVREASIGSFDLQLSGHTHRGQIFPFNLITKLFFPFQSGYYDLSKGSVLYVSRGAGTWGPPVRFGSPPEVTVIDIEPE